MNILLVEDDESLNRGLSFKLQKEGYNLFSAKTLKEAKEIFFNENIELILLDVGLPDGSGFDFCREIREKSNVFIIFLTSYDQEIEVITGYDIGADDYITKPFSLMVLLSKIRAFNRRNMLENKQDNIYISGDIKLNLEELKVYKNQRELSLTKTELKLLKFFMENSKRVLSKEQILNELWDIDGDFIDENTVAVNIRRLREKIEDNPSNPKYIKNIRGIGYIWTERCVMK